MLSISLLFGGNSNPKTNVEPVVLSESRWIYYDKENIINSEIN